MTAAWIRCPRCDDFWCAIHNQHTADCACPPIEEWNTDPYLVLSSKHLWRRLVPGSQAQTPLRRTSTRGRPHRGH